MPFDLQPTRVPPSLLCAAMVAELRAAADPFQVLPAFRALEGQEVPCEALGALQALVGGTPRFMYQSLSPFLKRGPLDDASSRLYAHSLWRVSSPKSRRVGAREVQQLEAREELLAPLVRQHARLFPHLGLHHQEASLHAALDVSPCNLWFLIRAPSPAQLVSLLNAEVGGAKTRLEAMVAGFHKKKYHKFEYNHGLLRVLLGLEVRLPLRLGVTIAYWAQHKRRGCDPNTYLQKRMQWTSMPSHTALPELLATAFARHPAARLRALLLSRKRPSCLLSRLDPDTFRRCLQPLLEEPGCRDAIFGRFALLA